MRQSESDHCNAIDLPFHPFLRHPHTDRPLQAVGRIRDRIIWPTLGASDDDGKGGADGNGEPDDKGGKPDDGGGSDDGKGGNGKSTTGDDTTDWKAKYEGRQEVVQNLEREFNKLKDGLKDVLGVEDKTSKPEELVAGLQQQLAEMQHNTLVSDVARRHGITDDNDIDFLRTAKDEDAMKRLADRLKPTDDSKDDDSARGRGRGPKPDKSQGSSSGESGSRPTSVEAVREERRRAREAAGKK